MPPWREEVNTEIHLSLESSCILSITAFASTWRPNRQLDPHAERRISAAIYIHDLSPGGVERQCLVLARELQARGADIVLVLHQRRGELVPLLPPGIPVVNLDSTRTLQDIWRLRRFLLDAQPDVFMANVDHNNVAAALAKAAACSGTKLVICQHNPLSAGYHATVNWKHRMVPWFYRALASHIDHAVAVSDGIAGELVGAGIPAGKGQHDFQRGDRRRFRGSGERAGAPSLAGEKGPPGLRDRGPPRRDEGPANPASGIRHPPPPAPSRLMLLGAGPMLDELRGLATSLGIAEHVSFEGFVPNPLPYMRAADAFVLSSRSEGFGNVLVEAMGCGTPVISTDCPHGPAEILANGRYGILVPPRDPDALAPAFDPDPG